MRRQRGFTLIEVIVALAIMITLAAVVIPTVVGSLDRARIDRAQDSLQAIADAISSFQNDVNVYPASLTQLIVALQNGSRDVCNNNMSWRDRRNWNGPYVQRMLTSSGLPVGIGTANDAFNEVNGFFGNPGEIQIVVSNVELADAYAMDTRMDDGDGQTSGTIQWTNPDADNFVTLYWVMPFPGC
jgi:type II secretion system protein G